MPPEPFPDSLLLFLPPCRTRTADGGFPGSMPLHGQHNPPFFPERNDAFLRRIRTDRIRLRRQSCAAGRTQDHTLFPQGHTRRHLFSLSPPSVCRKAESRPRGRSRPSEKETGETPDPVRFGTDSAFGGAPVPARGRNAVVPPGQGTISPQQTFRAAL